MQPTEAIFSLLKKYNYWVGKIVNRLQFFNINKYIRILLYLKFLLGLYTFIRTGFLISEMLVSPNFYMMASSGSSMMAPSGSSGGSGWTSFDLGVLEEPFPEGNDEGEEVAQPNPQAHPNQLWAIPAEPDLDSVKKIIQKRLNIHRKGRIIENEEIEKIIKIKGDILDRRAQLDFNPFWGQHRNTLIRDYLRPPQGGEFRICTLQRKLQDLFAENAESSQIFKELTRAK